MIAIDYHVHTDTSMDCKTPMSEMCARACEIGLSEIAFTDHFNNHLLDIDIGYYDPERFFKDIVFCRGAFPALRILAGVEVGEPHRNWRKAGPIIERYPYDIVLGSVHWVGNNNMFHPSYYQSRPAEKAFRAYFAEVKLMVEHGGFDVLAHMDVVKRTGFEVYKQYDARAFEPEIRDIWAACVKNNIIPEINTKSLRLAVREAHPGPDALKWYVEAGGTRLSMGSDAHRSASVGDGMHEARQAAQMAGITSLARFSQRKVIEV